MPNLTKLRHRAHIHQSGRCYYCGCPMWEDSPEPVARLLGVKVSQVRSLKCTAEHMTARRDGGANTSENIVAACQKCNCTRHKLKLPLPPDKYRQHVQRRIAGGKWHPFPVTQRVACNRGVLE